MNSQTKLKLNILKEKQVVSEATVGKVFIIEKLLREAVKNIESLDTDFMYTHLSMAINRADKNEQLTEDNIIIREQLEISEFFNEATELLQTASTLINIEFSPAEQTMILAHFCNMISQRGE